VGDFSIGSEIAGYRIEGLIARGGMGVVYRATHLGLERPVALKVIARELADRDGFRERFLRESRLAARLDHPSVVPIYDSREVDGELVVAMRLIEGGDLRAVIDREGPLSPHRALELLAQIADALDAAHTAGIVHRDVKPHNILVEGERAYLSDFGLAKAFDESGSGGTSVVGTAHYISPEQWRGDSIGPAADVYSLGCVLYEAITGIAPFARAEADTEPEMPQGVEEAIRRAVAKDPLDRFRSAGELIAAARAGQGSEVRPTAVLSDDRSERTTAPNPSQHWFGLRGRRAALWILSGFAVIAIAIAAAVLLLLGSEGPSVSAPIAIGRAPLRIAASSQAVWVTSGRDGTITRLDPVTGKPLGRPLHPGFGVAGIAIGGKWVWVTNPLRGRLLRLDPKTGRVLKTIDVGGHPGPIALGGGRVWIADESGRGVTAVNSEGGRIYRRGLPPQTTNLRLAFGARGLWASIAGTGSVRRLDPADFTTGAPILVGRGPAGLVVADGLVWVANSRSGTVSRVDPATRQLLGDPIEVGGHPGGIDAGTSAVWVANAADDTVTKIDFGSGEPDGDPIAVGPEPGAVAVGGEAVWVANNGDGTVTRIEP
jgi:DNA-binding beta-propeller fold protein YncE/predicted Ser/Thr protein kinase